MIVEPDKQNTWESKECIKLFEEKNIQICKEGESSPIFFTEKDSSNEKIKNLPSSLVGSKLEIFLSSNVHGDSQVAQFQKCCLEIQKREGEYFEKTQKGYSFSASKYYGLYEDGLKLGVTCKSSQDICELRASWQENLELGYDEQSCIDQYKEHGFEICPGSNDNMLQHNEL